jgi:hypothetical protein
LPMSHHDSQSCFSQRLNQRISTSATADFFNKIGPKRQFATVIRGIAKGFSGLRVGLAKPSGHILRLAASFRSALK